MKYGMRERISGAVILIALAVIFVPMLFDEPAPRNERPQPVLTIEQPVPVERRNVPDPQPPESLGQIRSPGTSPAPAEPELPVEGAEPGATAQVDPQPAVAIQQGEASSDSPPAQAPQQDPIADLAQAASERVASSPPADSPPEPQSPPATTASPAGEWAVQVGSFGEAGNAERLQARLEEEGFPVYSRRRDNNMTTVYVGPFDSSEAGERAMNTVKERANLQGLLVRVRD